MATQNTFGTFVKHDPHTNTDKRRVAHTAAESVRLRFDGWQPEPAVTLPPPVPVPAPAAAAEKPAEKKTTKPPNGQ